MKILNYEERIKKSEQISLEGQNNVMASIPQFSELAIHNIARKPISTPASIKAVVFNMERGVNLLEIIDFLKQCRDLQAIDILLANELDDGCERSGQLDTTKEIASALNLNYVYALEFIELVNENNIKGFHGNAIMSKWPISWAKAFYPQQAYDWYYSEQSRIGARLAIFAKIDVNGKEVGLITTHLENRTDPQGRLNQMQDILNEAKKYFPPNMPTILGGDLNTCMFVDTSVDEVLEFLEKTQGKTLDLMKEEPLLTLLKEDGYDVLGCNDIERATCRGRNKEAGTTGHRIDWIMSKNMKPLGRGTISTVTVDCAFAKKGSVLANCTKSELSDHDAVWFNAEI